MRVMEFIKSARGFLLAGFFLLFPFHSFVWAGPLTSDSPVPGFVTDASDNVFVQGAEINIKLDKKASGSSSQDSEVYKDLEDPFATDSEDLPVLTDPFEGYNRWMFSVNETIYDNMLEPVARGYRDTVHEDLRIGIKNAFSNAMAPIKLASSLLQLDFEKSGRVLARTLINTVFGFGGLADVAGEEYQIRSVKEDFDQAMGYYDIPTGPYVVLPIFGPSTARNIVGRVADSFMSPTFFFSPSTVVSVGISAEENINAASFIIDDKKQLEKGALDEYESVRDFYHQYRHGLVKK